MRVVLVMVVAVLGTGLLPGGAALADPIPPTASLLSSPPNPTRSADPVYTFTSDTPTATFECAFDGAPFTSCTSPAHFPGAPLADGGHTFSVRAVDAVNGIGPATSLATFTVDTAAPTASITGGPAGGGVTSDLRPTFTFTTADVGTGVTLVQCRFDTAVFATCVSPVAPTSNLANGSHKLDVRATDAVGNVSTVATRTFTVNPGAAVVQITGGPSGDIADKTPTFTFTTDPGTGSTITSVQCRFDSDAFGACTTGTSEVRTTPFADGSHTFEVRATNAASVVTTVNRGFKVHSGAASASFTVLPTAPLSNQAVTFTATSTDTDGIITENAWDLDNDGQFESTGAAATHVFRTPGTYTVRLRSTDQYGAVSVAQRSIVVANRPPAAAFVVSPASPVAGSPVTLIATSSDSDGPTPAAAWDLTGNGSAFADATGTSVSWTFPTAGTYVVRLRATDADGATDVVTQTIDVAPASGAASRVFLSPPPVVRLAGRITAKGVSVTLLSVKAPKGARVEIRCIGRSCPIAKVVRKQRKSNLFPVFTARLRAGVVLEIRVTMPGVIGKYTRFQIRRSLSPTRTDSCLMPGSKTPVKCPS